MSLHSAVLSPCAWVCISPHLVGRSCGMEMKQERGAMGTHRTYHERKYVFGQLVLTCRTRASLTQIELAEQIGVHRRSVQNWETGESYPKAETLQRMIAVFLLHRAFSPGTEREDSQALWDQAVHD